MEKDVSLPREQTFENASDLVVGRAVRDALRDWASDVLGLSPGEIDQILVGAALELAGGSKDAGTD